MRTRDYTIKEGYRIRGKHTPHIDKQFTGMVFQPYVYALAEFLIQRGDFKYLIDIGAGDGERIRKLNLVNVNVIAIDQAMNGEVLQKNLPQAQFINFDPEKGLPSISEDILKDAVVVSSGVIEQITEPHQYLMGLSHLSKVAPFVLIATADRTRFRGPEDFGPPVDTSHVREWTIDEFYSLLTNYRIDCRIGHTVSNNEEEFKGTTLAISGTQAMPRLSSKLETVLAIMSAYNEEDIIEQSITHLIGQGVAVHVLDNWSIDTTFEIIKKLAAEHKNVTYERFPASKPKVPAYEWQKILARVEELAVACNYDWVLHYDSDELRISPWRNVTLQQALTFVSQCGYNAVDFTVADFRPTKDGYDGKVHPDNFFHNFEFTRSSGNFVQVKGWKNIGPVNLVNNGGHMVEFDGRRIFPYKFINKHYPLRSVAQAKRKIFKDRKPRFVSAERKIGMHIHYDTFKEEDSYIWNEAFLKKYTPAYFYTEYMVELLSGIGIKVED